MKRPIQLLILFSLLSCPALLASSAIASPQPLPGEKGIREVLAVRSHRAVFDRQGDISHLTVLGPYGVMATGFHVASTGRGDAAAWSMADTTSTEKKRIKKNRKRTKQKTKGGGDSRRDDTDDGEDGDDAFFSCLFGIFEGCLFSGSNVAEPDGVVDAERAEPEGVGDAEQEAIIGSTETAYVDITEASWHVAADAAVPVFTVGDLRDEYTNDPVALSFETGLFVAPRAVVGLSVGYAQMKGRPQFDFLVGNTIESPGNSRFNMFSLGLGVGTVLPIAFSSDGDQVMYIGAGLGPALFYVREKAEITLVENSTITGRREDKLSEWRPGGQAKIEVGAILGPDVQIGAHVRYGWISWSAKGTKSLTLDFQDTNRLEMFFFGLSVRAVIY